MKHQLIGTALAAAFGTGTAVAADLQVNVEQVEHDRGQVRLELYNSDDGFRDAARALRLEQRPARPGTATFDVSGLTPGDYAIVVYHDEDGNGRMNRFLGMIPTEGYGLSNNPEISGPPQFEQAAFELSDPGATLAIRLKY